MNRIKNTINLYLSRFHVGENIRKKHIYRLFRKKIKKCQFALDGGCGRGDISNIFSKRYPLCQITAIDFDQELVNICINNKKYKNNNITFLKEDLSSLIYKGKYDVIFSVDVLEHLEDPYLVLRNLYNALREGGGLFIHTPHISQIRVFKSLKNWSQEDHKREGFDKNELTKELRNIGFKDIDIYYTFGIFGRSAWEIFTILNRINRLIAFLLFPALYPFILLDVVRKNKNGNGLLVYASK